MIVGYFDTRGRPCVEPGLSIPRLRIVQRVQFLVDTGAVTTCLHTPDAIRGNIPFGQLRDKRMFRGIGGSSEYFGESAILSFEDPPATRLYRVDLFIAGPDDRNQGLPSLLGRDVINHWYMEYDPSLSRLEFAVRHADYTLGAP